MSHMNVHQVVTSTEEDFNNQVDKMTHFVDTSQPLSSATLFITQWIHEKSGHGDRKEIMYELSNEDFHSPKLT